MLKTYEAPDVIEIGWTEDVVLGEKVDGFDNPDDPTRRPELSVLDADE